MKARIFVRLLLAAIVLSVTILSYPVQAGSDLIQERSQPTTFGIAYVNEGRDVSQSFDLTFEFEFLRNSVGVWSDGKGDLLLEQHIKNTSTDPAAVMESMTWWFNWPSADYTKIHALDGKGPLKTTTETSETVIFVTVNFRTPLQPGQTYKFKQFITIGEMIFGSGDYWTANWGIYPGSNVKSFEQVLALPANSTVTSVTPAVSERHGNILIWRGDNTTGDYSLVIEVPYVLSDSIAVGLFLQGADPWGDDIYAHNTEPSDTMARWGCLITSGAMLVNYFAATQDRANYTDPGVLNTWMINNSGYDRLYYVKHAWFGKYARQTPRDISMYWNSSAGYDTTLLDYYLRSGYPVILGVKPEFDPVTKRYYPSHWVVATGKTTGDGVDTYSINDPIYGQTTLKKQYLNNALVMVTFSASEANQQLLYFAAQSPIHFVITDPLERKAGYDPTTDTLYEEIPGAYYLYEGLSDAFGKQEPRVAKTLTIPDPVDGPYLITVYGIGNGAYTMEASAMDWQGVTMDRIFTGTVTEGQVITYKVTYSEVIYQTFLPIAVR